MGVLKLKNGIIYGPVMSRRFGPSLGINLLPESRKACSFDCVYCHCGWTEYHSSNASKIARFFPSLMEIESAVVDAIELERGAELNALTFSGNGEPTLHPRFAEVVDSVLMIRDRALPGVAVQVLSNSTTLYRRRVVEALGRLDRRVMKLDAGTEELFAAINRPAEGVELENIVDGLSKLEDVTIQTAFMAGSVDNSGDEAVEAWIDKLRRIQPSAVQIYTIDRPPADEDLERVPRQRLESIAEDVRRAGFEAEVF